MEDIKKQEKEETVKRPRLAVVVDKNRCDGGITRTKKYYIMNENDLDTYKKKLKDIEFVVVGIIEKRKEKIKKKRLKK